MSFQSSWEDLTIQQICKRCVQSVTLRSLQWKGFSLGETKTMLRFVIPTEGRESSIRYASYVSGPYESFVTHGTLHGAKNSFRNRAGMWRNGSWTFRDGKILELVEGNWYTLYDVKDVTDSGHLPWHYPVETATYEKNPDYNPAEYIPGQQSWIRKTEVNYVARPMTRDEYANWLVRVHMEIWDAGF
jgi:hypothetical protein